ncbi:MAG: hypothetical protein K0R73_1174 [Candidatus Midichloriaceae bacterium]|jgi:predicted dienelactone hydrolase|nr:hypothetical protein [Candidatus Midichloriaceae bacterium]
MTLIPTSTFNRICRIIAIFLLLVSIAYTNKAIAIGTQEISFTIPNTGRDIVAEIYYPTDDVTNNKVVDHGIWQRKAFTKDAQLSSASKKYPLIIFSHGFQGDRFGNSWFAESLVAKGYIVAMIEHTHNTSYEHSDLFIYSSMWQRPLDTSQLLTHLLQDSKWGKVIDSDRIQLRAFHWVGLLLYG